MADYQNELEAYEQQMPYNLEAEQSVLGAILIDPSNLSRVMGELTPDCFYRSQHREKDQKQQHVVFPLSHITPTERFASSVIIGSENRPQSTMAAASTANGSFIRMPGSQLTTFSMPSSGRKYIDSAGPIR